MEFSAISSVCIRSCLMWANVKLTRLNEVKRLIPTNWPHLIFRSMHCVMSESNECSIHYVVVAVVEVVALLPLLHLLPLRLRHHHHRLRRRLRRHHQLRAHTIVGRMDAHVRVVKPMDHAHADMTHAMVVSHHPAVTVHHHHRHRLLLVHRLVGRLVVTVLPVLSMLPVHVRVMIFVRVKTITAVHAHAQHHAHMVDGALVPHHVVLRRNIVLLTVLGRMVLVRV